MKVKLSVVVITYNESANIERCLKSVSDIADEMLVVDSYSEDDTRKKAEALGARVEEHAFEGHIEQKNYAISLASYPHVLSLDADEALSDTLKQKIQAVKSDWQYDGYKFNRLTNYCGRWIKHGGWYPDTKLRLFDSRLGSWQGENPHDKYVLKQGSSIQHVKGDILHYSYYTVSDHIRQIDFFSGIKADVLFKKGARPGFIKRYFAAGFKFFSSYILKAGFLDGYEGYIIARLSATSTLMKYYKLHRKYQKRS